MLLSLLSQLDQKAAQDPRAEFGKCVQDITSRLTSLIKYRNTAKNTY